MTSKLAVIGGYAEGFGAAQADALRQAGWTVVGISRRGQGGYTCDLTDEAAVEATVAQIENDHGPIHAYLHNPHALIRGPIQTLTANDFESAWRASV